MSKQTFFTVLLLLTCYVGLLQGIPTFSRERCFCRGLERISMNENHIAKVEYHRPSISCGQEELVVTFRNSQRSCLNLKEVQGRRIKEAIMKKSSAN